MTPANLCCRCVAGESCECAHHVELLLPKPEKRGPKPPRPIQRKAPIARRSARPKKPKPLARRWLMRVADEVVSLFHRAKRRCEACDKPFSVPELQWMHGWSRSWHSIRYTEANNYAGCAECHVRYTHRPELWFTWLQNRLGMEAWQALATAAQSHERPDLVGIIRTYWQTPQVQGALLECSESKQKRLTREVGRALA